MLAKYIETHSQFVAGKVVVELGAGSAFPALTAAGVLYYIRSPSFTFKFWVDQTVICILVPECFDLTVSGLISAVGATRVIATEQAKGMEHLLYVVASNREGLAGVGDMQVHDHDNL